MELNEDGGHNMRKYWGSSVVIRKISDTVISNENDEDECGDRTSPFSSHPDKQANSTFVPDIQENSRLLDTGCSTTSNNDAKECVGNGLFLT